MTDQSDTQALFENELDRVRRYLPHSSFANLRAAAEIREQAHKDRVEKLEEALKRAAFIVDHLLQMVPASDFSDEIGPEGQHKGDFIRDDIGLEARAWKELAGD